MNTITTRGLVWFVVAWALTACTSASSTTLTPAGPPIVTPTTVPTSLPTASPSLTPTQLPPTPNSTKAATGSPTPRPLKTSVPPTVPSEGWGTRTLLVGPGNPGRLYALQGDREHPWFDSAKRRLLMSDDLGNTWKAFPGGLPVEPVCLANVDLDYATREALYASTCQGLFRWNGGQWVNVSPQVTYHVAIVYGQPQEIWAVAAPEKGGPVLRSDDGGKTWSNASEGLVHFSGLATLAIDPQNAQTLYGIIMRNTQAVICGACPSETRGTLCPRRSTIGRLISG